MKIVNFLSDIGFQRVGKCAFLRSSEGNKTILKVRSEANYWYQKLARKLLGGDTSFDNEMMVYEQLPENRFAAFRYPQLIKTDHENFLLLRFIQAEQGWNKELVSKERVLSALLEFNLSDISITHSGLKRIVTRFVRSSTAKVLRWSFSLNSYSPWYFFKIVAFLISAEIKQGKNQRALLMHNDLNVNNNVLSDQDGSPWFLDFESVTLERKWVFIDVLNLCVIEKNRFEFDADMLRQYLCELDKRGVLSKNFDISLQLRVVLMRVYLQSFRYQKNPELKEVFGHFLTDVLLDKKVYENWYNSNIGLDSMKIYSEKTEPANHKA
ncbi:hypothetical protein [Halomonas sp. E14]|uniref:hypothetical protein n=1 Tax=Halomonas sp. E14 TaxID=3397245 RepID=UPI00403E54DD